MASVTAVHRVLHTPELLEGILLHLAAQGLEGLKAVLFSQQVCRQFRNTFQGSPELSKALYLSPTSGKVKSTTVANPFLPFIPFHEPDSWLPDDFYLRLEMTPLTGKELIRDDDDKVRITTYRYEYPDGKPRSRRSESCWRKMYLMNCEYHVTRVRYVKRDGFSFRCGSSGGTFATIKCDRMNPTLGELFDVALPGLVKN